MGLRYDCAASVLLCTEDNSSILGLDDDREVGEEDVVNGESTRSDLGQALEEQGSRLCGDTLMGFPPQSEECIAHLVEKESEHLPMDGYANRLHSGSLDMAVRRDAINWFEQVRARYNLGPLTAYLSVNYLDRFLSATELPQGKAWMSQLISVACLSLAAKMEEREVPLCLDLQVANARYVFEARTIQRMELLVLSTLKWRMRAITPFSFIHYFLRKFGEESAPKVSAVRRSEELILETVRGTEFLDFTPSEIAAAVALLTLKGNQILEIDEPSIRCALVEKGRVIRCGKLLQNRMMAMKKTIISNHLSLSEPQTDVACVSYKSSDITASDANSHQTSPAAKKRKLFRHSIS